MALTGELSDLSLAELIEFFCNQRKTGRLKIIYPHGAGYFYLQAGSVVHARIGQLRGIDAVYSALTLPNASFRFSPSVEAAERTINQPWTQVVLEGLRRMDEGVIPGEAFPPGYIEDPDEEDSAKEDSTAQEDSSSHLPAFLSGFSRDSGSRRSQLATAGVVAVILLVVAVVGVPAGWYSRNKPVQTASQPPTVITSSESPSSPNAPPDSAPAAAESSASDGAAHNNDAALLAARRERAKAREEKAGSSSAASKGPLPAAGANAETAKSAPPAQKKVTVQVSYDENGRVTQASGGDATALRIARQKRFPAGKAGSATVTIPIN